MKSYAFRQLFFNTNNPQRTYRYASAPSITDVHISDPGLLIPQGRYAISIMECGKVIQTVATVAGKSHCTV